MMPRWHHSDSSSERYQEVKSIKTFYAAHISRSQVKSMFGNWTTVITHKSLTERGETVKQTFATLTYYGLIGQCVSSPC